MSTKPVQRAFARPRSRIRRGLLLLGAAASLAAPAALSVHPAGAATTSSITDVVNKASLNRSGTASVKVDGIAAGSAILVRGRALSNVEAVADPASPCTMILANRMVQVTDFNGNSQPACLRSVSGGEIDAVAPDLPSLNVDRNRLATVEVLDSSSFDGEGYRVVASTQTPLRAIEPGLYAAGNGPGNRVNFGPPAGYVVQVNPDGSQGFQYDLTRPVTRAPGQRLFLVLYGTGIHNRSNPPRSTVTVAFSGPQGTTTSTASFAPEAGNPVGRFAFGLDQVNVEIPVGVTGTVGVTLRIDDPTQATGGNAISNTLALTVAG